MMQLRSHFPIATTLGLGLWIIAVSFPMSGYLEASMTRHVVIQLPSLALVGWLIGSEVPGKVRRSIGKFNPAGITGLVIAFCVLIFWMVPRSLDESLIDWQMAIVKYLSIPLLFGLPLRVSWSSAPVWLRGFAKVNFLSMLIFLAGLYFASPDQLCNSYSRDEQLILSETLVKIVLVLSIVYSIRPVFGDVFRHLKDAAVDLSAIFKKRGLADEHI